MAYLGRRGALAPLTSADIPAGIIEGTDIAFLENSSGQNLGGTYSTERMYLSGRTGSAPNDYNYKLTGNLTVTGHLALGSIADEDIIITNDGTERTITTDASGGTLEAGELLQSKQTDLTGMTGTLGSVVTGSPNLNLGNATGTIGSGVTGLMGNAPLNYLGSNYFMAYLIDGQTISMPQNEWTTFMGATELGTTHNHNSRFTESSGKYIPVNLGFYYVFGFFSINDQSSANDRCYISIAKNDGIPDVGLGIADGTSGEDLTQRLAQTIIEVDDAADFIRMKGYTNAGGSRYFNVGATFGGFKIA